MVWGLGLPVSEPKQPKFRGNGRVELNVGNIVVRSQCRKDRVGRGLSTWFLDERGIE